MKHICLILSIFTNFVAYGQQFQPQRPLDQRHILNGGSGQPTSGGGVAGFPQQPSQYVGNVPTGGYGASPTSYIPPPAAPLPCFERHANRQAECLVPSDRLTSVPTLDDCLDMCAQLATACVGVQYSEALELCDVFSSRNAGLSVSAVQRTATARDSVPQTPISRQWNALMASRRSRNDKKRSKHGRPLSKTVTNFRRRAKRQSRSRAFYVANNYIDDDPLYYLREDHAAIKPINARRLVGRRRTPLPRTEGRPSARTVFHGSVVQSNEMHRESSEEDRAFTRSDFQPRHTWTEAEPLTKRDTSKPQPPPWLGMPKQKDAQGFAVSRKPQQEIVAARNILQQQASAASVQQRHTLNGKVPGAPGGTPGNFQPAPTYVLPTAPSAPQPGYQAPTAGYFVPTTGPSFPPNPTYAPPTQPVYITLPPQRPAPAPHSVYPSSQPNFPSPQPSYPAPQPSYAAPQPSYPAPQPSYPSPQPSYPALQPSYPAPQPSYPAPQPSYPAPQPSYPAPQPSYLAPQPSYLAPQPSYPAPQPSHPAPEPSYPAPQSSYPAPQPSYPAPQPAYPAPAPIPYTTPAPPLCDTINHGFLVYSYSFDYYVPTGACGVGGNVGPGTPGTPGSPGTPGTSDDSSCPTGESEVYVEIETTRLRGNTGITSFETSSLAECLAACTSNRLPSGATITCESLDYTSSSGECRLSTDTVVPSGGQQPEFDAETSYYEKICVDTLLTSECPGPYTRIPQSILVGFAETVVTADGLNACLKECLNAEELYGFECRSAMHFYDEPSDNCVLNFETAESQPSSVSETFDDAVDYLELNCGFQRNFRSRNSIFQLKDTVTSSNMLSTSRSWSSWTPCNQNSRQRSRFRMCQKYNPRPSTCEKERQSCGNRQQGRLSQWPSWQSLSHQRSQNSATAFARVSADRRKHARMKQSTSDLRRLQDKNLLQRPENRRLTWENALAPWRSLHLV